MFRERRETTIDQLAGIVPGCDSVSVLHVQRSLSYAHFLFLFCLSRSCLPFTPFQGWPGGDFFTQVVNRGDLPDEHDHRCSTDAHDTSVHSSKQFANKHCHVAIFFWDVGDVAFIQEFSDKPLPGDFFSGYTVSARMPLATHIFASGKLLVHILDSTQVSWSGTLTYNPPTLTPTHTHTNNFVLTVFIFFFLFLFFLYSFIPTFF